MLYCAFWPVSRQRVGDREQQHRPDAVLERVDDVAAGGELRTRVGRVVPEPEVLVVAVQNPVRLGRRSGCAAYLVEVQHPEGPRYAQRVVVERRVLLEARTPWGARHMRFTFTVRPDSVRL